MLTGDLTKVMSMLRSPPGSFSRISDPETSGNNDSAHRNGSDDSLIFDGQRRKRLALERLMHPPFQQVNISCINSENRHGL